METFADISILEKKLNSLKKECLSMEENIAKLHKERITLLNNIKRDKELESKQHLLLVELNFKVDEREKYLKGIEKIYSGVVESCNKEKFNAASEIERASIMMKQAHDELRVVLAKSKDNDEKILLIDKNKKDVDKKIYELSIISSRVSAQSNDLDIREKNILTKENNINEEKELISSEKSRLFDISKSLLSRENIVSDKERLASAKINDLDCKIKTIEEERRILHIRECENEKLKESLNLDKLSFSRQIDALSSREKDIEIRRLRVEKIIKDNNIENELKTLSAELKEKK